MTDEDLLLKAKEALSTYIEVPEAAAADLPTDVKDGEIVDGDLFDNIPIDTIP